MENIKKIGICLLWCCIVCGPCAAAGAEEAASHSVQLAVSAGGGVHVDGRQELMQRGVFSGALSLLFFIDKYVALGLEGAFFQMDAKGGGLPYNGAPFWRPWMQEKDNYFSAWGLAAAGRIYFNPDSRFRVYIPAGVGYMSLKHETQYEYAFDWPAWTDWEEEPYKEDEKVGDGLYVYSGLGLEYDLTSSLALGLEGRAQAFKYSNQWLSTVTAMLTLGVKF